jgi:hypothetical protein
MLGLRGLRLFQVRCIGKTSENGHFIGVLAESGQVQVMANAAAE